MNYSTLAAIGRSIESECRVFYRRRIIKNQQRLDQVTEEILALPKGSVEWVAKMREFGELDQAIAADRAQFQD